MGTCTGADADAGIGASMVAFTDADIRHCAAVCGHAVPFVHPIRYKLNINPESEITNSIPFVMN